LLSHEDLLICHLQIHQKKARIYPVMDELGDLTGEKNTSQPNQTEQDNQTDNQNSNQQ